MNTRAKILIVDDDHDALDMMEIILYRDYTVITAMNGFEALNKVDQDSPDLIITDIMMPVMNGIRFLNSLRKHSQSSKTPVIAVTSFGSEYPARSLVSMGFSAVLPKPPDKSAVLEKVKAILYPVSEEEHPADERQES